MQSKIVVTGASGFVGRQLVPRLIAAGHSLLVVGRDPAALAALFPGIAACGYDEIASRARGFDALVHLAVLNNSVTAPEDDFARVNVGLLQATLAACRAAGIGRFYNITTFHALDGKGSAYARSKRDALDLLGAQEGLAITNVFLPAVHGDDFAGKLALVKRVPGWLRRPSLAFLSSLAPTVHVDRLAAFLSSDPKGAPEAVLLANPQDKNAVYRFGRRAIDLLFALAVIALAGWLMLLVWLFVRLDSPGPGIFAQTRVGLHGRPFTCLKFRTMKAGTRQAGTHEMTADAITGIGAWLRKTKVDELPQVWNILRGEISLVGPRPGLPVQTELLAVRTARGVLEVLPGITGLAQINGIDMSDPRRLAEMDARYIAQRGLVSDIGIILATFLGRGQGDKVRAG